jgi:hypothetical protein
MAAIRARAEQEQARDVPVKILGADAMPVELQRTGLEFVGARTAHVTLWLRGDQTQAAATAQWGERAIALLAFLAGQESAGTVTSHASDYRWLVMVRSKEEYDQVLDSNADRMDKAARATARRFGGTAMPVTGGNAYLLWHAVELDNDAIIGHYAEFCVGAYVNQGLGEGFVHAMTWMLVGTTHAHYGSVATTSAGGPNSPAFHADEWLAELRDQVRTGADIPLAQVLRERRTNFRTDVRRKSWWVMIWLVARYPDKWLPLVQALHPRSGKVALPADDEAAFQKVLGRTIADIDAEWRVWALGETPFAKASPYGGASR